MTPQQFELRVMDMAERAKKGVAVEDSFWELKKEWPENESKAARRIAAHCNTARGGLAAWIIGIADDGKIVGADPQEYAQWWPKVKAEFEGTPPELDQHCSVSIDGKQVVGLLFDSTKRPFVVYNPHRNERNAIQLEVPWREGTAVRPARRQDLLKILVPVSEIPRVTVRQAHMWQSGNGRMPEGPFVGMDCVNWWMELLLFFELPSPARVIIPYHRCRVEVSSQNSIGPIVEMSGNGRSTFSHNSTPSKHVHVATNECTIDDSGSVALVFDGWCPLGENARHIVCRAKTTLLLANADTPIVLHTELLPWHRPDHNVPHWMFREKGSVS